MAGPRHPFFGGLDQGGWVGTANVGGHEVKLELLGDDVSKASAGALDTVASSFKQAAELARRGRAAIDAEEANPESATAMYIGFIGDELAPAGLEGPALAAHVLGRLVPVRLWTWLDDGVEQPAVVLDFSYAPGELDHVLAVRFDAAGRVEAVDLES